MDKIVLFKKIALCSSVSLLAFSIASNALANPQDGKVIAGSATTHAVGKKLDIHQKSSKAVIDWRSFNIEVDEHTQFHQPSSSATVLNRVNNSDPSHIMGKLSANGNVILINPNGVFFGKDSKVDVNGLIATSSDINNKAFMDNYHLHFNEPGNTDAAIINEGTITAKEAGLVGLVAPQVANHGVITAKLGRVELASGEDFIVDLYGDGLYEIKVSDEVKSQIIDNTGKISAEGGVVALTAAAGKEIVQSLVTIGGELKAPSIKKQGGKIIITAEGSNAVAQNKAEDKGKKKGNSTVLVANAKLDASGINETEQGGEIEITGDNIGILQNSIIDASGHSAVSKANKESGTATMTADKKVRTEEEFLGHENRAGGSIKIGGDYLGKGETPAARNVYVDRDSLILNDALQSGDGGRTIIWSDNITQYYGNVYSRGGLKGGNGGFLETSGKKFLDAKGTAELASQKGFKKGTYLLDPTNISIYGNVDPKFISTDNSIDLASSIQLWLDAADSTQVELTYSTDALSSATASGSSGGNTITTSADVSASLGVGARIRLGAAGSVTTADTLGADTYTIAAISGTTITTEETLTSTYSASTLYRGLISQWGDKSGQNRHAVQALENKMPLYLFNRINGNGSLYFNGSGDFVAASSLPAMNQPLTIEYIAKINPATNGLVGGIGFFWGYQGNKVYAGGMATYSITPTNWNIVIWKSNSGSSTANVNGGTFQAISPGGGNIGGGTLNIATDNGVNNPWSGDIADQLVYNKGLTTSEQIALQQYQSAKWGIALDPTTDSNSEATEAMASNGYSVFTTRYLERLSASADIVLQADSDINLDLKGDTLTIDDDKSITIQTTSGDISTDSAGSIVTNRTTTGGNITLNAGGTGNINFDHAFTLNAQNGGDVSLTAGGGNININDDFNITADSFNLTGTLSGAGTGAFSYQQSTAGNTLGVGTGGSPNITLPDALITSIISAFANYSFGRTDGGSITNNVSSWDGPLTFLTNSDFTNSVATSSDDTILVRAGGDVILNDDIATTSATANALVLSAAGNFINNAGSNALSASNSRWLVYSNAPSGNTRDGLLPTASEFNKNYGADAPATIGSGNRFVYNTSTQPTLVYQVGDGTVVNGASFSGTPSLTYSSGLVGDDTLLNIGLTGTASTSTTYTPGDSVGIYSGALTATAGTLSNPLGYLYSFTPGNLTVTKKPAQTSILPSTVLYYSQKSITSNIITLSTNNPATAATQPQENTKNTNDPKNKKDGTLLTISSKKTTSFNAYNFKEILGGLVKIHESLKKQFHIKTDDE